VRRLFARRQLRSSKHLRTDSHSLQISVRQLSKHSRLAAPVFKQDLKGTVRLFRIAVCARV
jgi:hypothetical protein